MIFFAMFFGACISSFPIGKEEFVDNPTHDFDNDGLSENDGDCDDNRNDIQKKIWYVDADGDGFGLESLQTSSRIYLSTYCCTGIRFFSLDHTRLEEIRLARRPHVHDYATKT